MRCETAEVPRFAKLMELFFAYERAEIAEFRRAVEQFKVDLPAVLAALRSKIEDAHASNPAYQKAEAKFLKHAQETINPTLGTADVREMLIQHILTEEIFSKVFDDSEFHTHNNIAKELYALEGTFFTGSLKKQTLRALDPYYAAIRASAAQISSHAEKKTFLKVKPGDVSSADDPSAIPCMRTKNIQLDLEDEDLVYIPRQSIKSDKVLRVGDILVSSANSWNLVGKCSWVPALNYEATFGGFTSVLRATSKNIWPRYLYHWFSTDRIQALARSFGQQTTNISNLNQARCLELEIPLPPLDEQRRIAAILDQADALRRKRKRALELLDTLTQSIFVETFVCANSAAWPTCKVESLATNIRTGPFGSQLLHSEFVDEGIAVLGIDNAVANRFRWGERRHITPTKYDELRRYTVLPGDVLVTIMGTCGRCAVVPDDIPPAINTKHLCCITLDRNKCLPEVLQAALLRHPAILKQLGVQAKGAVMPGLNMGIIKSLTFPLPPLKLQEAYVRTTRGLLQQIDMGESAMRQSDILFASLQHRAFSGQL